MRRIAIFFLAASMVQSASASEALWNMLPDQTWDGPYIGAAVGAHSYGSDYNYFSGEIFAGVNFHASEAVLVGLEGSIGAMDNGKDPYGHFFVVGRAGVLPNDKVLVYGVAGLGIMWYLPDAGLWSEPVYQLGAGVEFSATDTISVRAQVTAVGYLTGGDSLATRPTIGAAFHF